MLLLQLFTTFFMLGFVSFGGGYAMIPLIQEEVVNRHGWMTNQHFSDIIAVAGTSPGPIATNCAVFIGYDQSGLAGAILATAGVTLPSLIIIVAISAVFYKINQNHYVKSAFYGLRSVVMGLILYSALLIASSNGMFSSLDLRTVSMLAIYAGSLFALIRYRVHPVLVIILSGMLGITLYS